MGKIVSVYEHFGLRTFRFTNDLQERNKFVNRGMTVVVRLKLFVKRNLIYTIHAESLKSRTLWLHSFRSVFIARIRLVDVLTGAAEWVGNRCVSRVVYPARLGGQLSILTHYIV